MLVKYSVIPNFHEILPHTHPHSPTHTPFRCWKEEAVFVDCCLVYTESNSLLCIEERNCTESDHPICCGFSQHASHMQYHKEQPLWLAFGRTHCRYNTHNFAVSPLQTKPSQLWITYGCDTQKVTSQPQHNWLKKVS